MRLDMVGMLKIAFLVAILFPIIVEQLIDPVTTSWPTQLVTIWDNLPIIAGLGLIIGFLGFTETGKQAIARARGRK